MAPLTELEAHQLSLIGRDCPMGLHPGVRVECSACSEKKWADLANGDAVNHPRQHTAHPSGVECIDIVEHMTFCAGNAVKYIWRAGLKSADPIEDLRKAEFYVKREIERIERMKR